MYITASISLQLLLLKSLNVCFTADLFSKCSFLVFFLCDVTMSSEKSLYQCCHYFFSLFA